MHRAGCKPEDKQGRWLGWPWVDLECEPPTWEDGDLQPPSRVILGRSHKGVEPQVPCLQNGPQSSYSVERFGRLKEAVDVKVLQKGGNVAPVEDIALMTMGSPEH